MFYIDRLAKMWWDTSWYLKPLMTVAMPFMAPLAACCWVLDQIEGAATSLGELFVNLPSERRCVQWRERLPRRWFDGEKAYGRLHDRIYYGYTAVQTVMIIGFVVPLLGSAAISIGTFELTGLGYTSCLLGAEAIAISMAVLFISLALMMGCENVAQHAASRLVFAHYQRD